MAEKFRIAVVRAMDGHATVCGPNDYREPDHAGAMDAALCWHLEAGHLPAECLWIEAELPPIPDFATLQAQAERGEFPRSLLDGDA